MKNVQWIFVMYAVLAATALALIGITVAERSTIGIIGSILLLIIVMGFGFRQKKKVREQNNG
ncbi:DUF5325 family protein [Sutcliffiella cohnii]|uniref:YlaF family protein n=2 Tax=Bacillaceae TaxID=186817 RepID=A0A223KRV0_9BACI|nr:MULTISPECIES: DUF5325 family protein [Sutcliffiella]AST92199.1 hypothetical protein BC6307_13345 [Sutcliffiella cohnii]MED4015488.1 DUF5325 family protein [Sutcliffiella cohnii]WBL17621.1 DUF5325 family protein [Sutcliffiella sp. NC1]